MWRENHKQNPAMERGLVCPEKAQEFDKLHAKPPKFGRNKRGAKELASGYTGGKRKEWLSSGYGRGVE